MPFLLSAEPASPEPWEAEAPRRTLACGPTHLLVVAAMCNASHDHLVLAEVSAFLAERLGALILLESYEPLPEHVVSAGRCNLVVPSTKAAPQLSLVDSTVLRAWTRDTRFALVK